MDIVNTRWVAVRCCCKPHKVLGFLQLTEDQYFRRQFTTPYLDGAVSLRPITESKRDFDTGLSVTWEIAIYSEDRPIEQWRRVPGFIEAL